MKEVINIPGYTYGTGQVSPSALTLADSELVKKSLLFGDEDVKYLRLSPEGLQEQIEEILDVW